MSIAEDESNNEDANSGIFSFRSSLMDSDSDFESTSDRERDDITKLDFSRLKGTYGRENDLALLREVCSNAFEGEGSFQRCMIRGKSGVGKSNLVRQLIKSRGDGTITAYGKFEQEQASSEPFSSISSILEELCDACAEHKSLREKLEKTVGLMGASVLGLLVPRAHQIFFPGEMDWSAKSVKTQQQALGNIEALEQLKFVLRSFLRCMCTQESPVIIFCDDLQWADQASMDLLIFILRDETIKYLLFIGAYREDEVAKEGPLQGALDLQQEEGSHFITHNIALANLDKRSVHQLVEDLLRPHNAKDVDPLVDIILRRTQGQTLFVLEFLKLLHEQKLLEYSIAFGRWDWDSDKIATATQATNNVADLIVSNMHNLPVLVQQVLQIVSCLANKFNLQSVWEVVLAEEQRTASEHDQEDEKEDFEWSDQTKICSFLHLRQLVNVAVTEGFLERVATKEDCYCFAHDRFQQAAYATLDKDLERRRALHHRIGHALLPHSVDEYEAGQWELFVAVDQMNKGRPSSSSLSNQEDGIHLAQLNLIVGQMAKRMSAYSASLQYFEAGIKCLPPGMTWEKQYDLCLDLYNASAEVALANGNLEVTKSRCQTVMLHGKNDKDKYAASSTYIQCLSSQQKSTECLEMGFQMLQVHFGERLPQKPSTLHVILGFVKTQWTLKKFTDEKLLSLPMMDDKDQLRAMEVLNSLEMPAFFAKENEVLALLNFRQIRLSIKYGLSGYSATSFVTYGMIICAAEDNIKEGYRFGKLAGRLLKNNTDSMQQFEAQVTVISATFLLHWLEPLQNLFDPLLRAYKSGLQNGDVKFAVLGSSGYIITYLHSGLKLDPIVKDASSFCAEMKDYKQETALYSTLPFWQFGLNLMGQCNNPLVLEGAALSKEVTEEIMAQHTQSLGDLNIWYSRMMLAFFFGQYEAAHNYAKEAQNLIEPAKAAFTFVNFIYISGLIHLELAKSRKRRKYISKAKTAIRRMKKWAKDGGVNVYHKLLILIAQCNAVTGGTGKRKVDLVLADFDKAISSAGRAGFVNDQAIAHQLLGDYFQIHSEYKDAAFHFSRAHACYLEWGAKAVADHVQDKYADVLAQYNSEDGLKSFTMKARQRFTGIEKPGTSIRGFLSTMI